MPCLGGEFVISTFAAFAPWQSFIGLFTQFLEWLFTLTMKMGVPSYILAILIFTIIVKVLLQPLMNKQMRSAHKMQMLQPELKEIQRRYANNQQMMQQATMELYKKNGASPMAGCLPLLIQFPILIALYQGMLRIAQNGPAYPEYFSIPWFGGETLALSSPDPTWVLPIAAAVFTFLQQYISTTNRQDKTQKMMLIIFPLMFLFMVRSFPAMMAFYWIFYSVIGTLIYLPFKLKWAREDKKMAEELAAKRAQEEAEREAKKEELRIRNEKRQAERRARAAKKAGLKNPAQPEKAPSYFDMVNDPDYDDPDIPEEELAAEKAFRAWLLQEGVVKVKNKKTRLHPWSEEEEIVLSCFLKNGADIPLSSYRAKYEKILKENPNFGPKFPVAEEADMEETKREDAPIEEKKTEAEVVNEETQAEATVTEEMKAEAEAEENKEK